MHTSAAENGTSAIIELAIRRNASSTAAFNVFKGRIPSMADGSAGHPMAVAGPLQYMIEVIIYWSLQCFSGVQLKQAFKFNHFLTHI